MITPDISQANAIEFACNALNANCIITGGAGTGKTTIIKEIADRLGGNATILAPTGKAAARLKEATGYFASTIHSALCWDGVKINRTWNFNEPVIVDESSMVDAWLMAKLLSFNPPKLILVGDQAQLPPVGQGQPFHDLIKLRPDLVCELTHCWRAQGAVHIAAQAIRRGVYPADNLSSGGEVWRMFNTGEAAATTEQILKWIKSGHYDPMQDMILSPRYGTGGDDYDGGIDSLNAAIKTLINPSQSKFAPGDRIICNKNFAKEDLWNGDIGTIRNIDTEGQLWVILDRDTNERLVKKDMLKEIRHAYALSIHKAQGSQARNVFLIVLRSHWYQLERSLIYTGVTRAKKGVCVIGQLQAFQHGVKTVKTKTTVLQWLGNHENLQLGQNQSIRRLH
jgi:exodeoxyribonuclease V alpha subunit